MFDLERNSNGLKLTLYIICLIIIFSIMMEIPVIPVIPVCVCFLSFNCSLSLSLILSFYQHFLKMFSFAHVLLSPLFFPFQTSGCFTSFLFSPSLLCVFVQSANTTWLNRLAVRCNCVTMVTRGPLFHFDNHCSLEFPWHPTLLSLSRLLIFSLGCFSPSAPQAFLEFLKKMSTPYGSDDYTLLYHTHTHTLFFLTSSTHILSLWFVADSYSQCECVLCVCVEWNTEGKRERACVCSSRPDLGVSRQLIDMFNLNYLYFTVPNYFFIILTSVFWNKQFYKVWELFDLTSRLDILSGFCKLS